MKYLQAMENKEFFVLAQTINQEVQYPKRPTSPKKYMTVKEMGDLLGIKKTERYYLVHKNLFQTDMVLGHMRVNVESFEKWYASQTWYHKVTGEEPGKALKISSYSVEEIAEILHIQRESVYVKMKEAGIEFIEIAHRKRYLKKSFDAWYCKQKRYCYECDMDKEEIERISMSMPEMARLLGISRQKVYDLLQKEPSKLKCITIGVQKRILKDSFFRWYDSQNTYQIVKEKDHKLVANESNRQLANYRREKISKVGSTKYVGNEKYLTIDETSKITGVARKTLSRWISKGQFPAIKDGRNIRILRTDVDNWLKERVV